MYYSFTRGLDTMVSGVFTALMGLVGTFGAAKG